jgi:F-type H+-transporting ATPase subunit gamma
MSAFKEIKKRINAVKSTRKTTSAMKMVSSAKLHKAESRLADLLPYARALQRITAALLAGDPPPPEQTPALCLQRPVDGVAVVAFASDSSLCGAFNSNVSRALRNVVETYRRDSLPDENIFVYTVGKKVCEAIGKTDIAVTRNFENLAAKPDYGAIADLAGELIDLFEGRKIDRVEVIYHHFKNAASQLLVNGQLLPVVLPAPEKADHAGYIYEPSRREILRALLPKSVKLQLYAMLLDSNTSEHAARMVAMQTATDNADELVDALTLEYNKSRQQAITGELLDIAGGSL